MSTVKETANAQSVVYADVYAIIIPPTIHNDYDAATFLSATGTTTWASHARLFDDANSAIATAEELEIEEARIVKLSLQYVATTVDVVCAKRRRRRKAA
jgi:hypothetical protein